jgi:enoyl-CoA hydratase
LPAAAIGGTARDWHMSTFEFIIVERQGAVGILRLNRPKLLNALSFGVFGEIGAAIDDLEDDDAIGCIVLTGNEKAFAAGADIKEMQPKTFIDMFNSDFTAIGGDRVARCRKPTIAAVAGYALGGGCELAMMCDIIIAADTAKFGQPEITLGTIPGIGGTQRLTRAIGKSKAMDLCLTGRMMDAAEAERAGLVSRVVPADKLMEEALAAAEKIASMSQPAAEMAKRAINRAFETTLAEGMEVERDLFRSTFALEDRVEGMAAFVEKRKPQNKNR